MSDDNTTTTTTNDVMFPATEPVESVISGLAYTDGTLDDSVFFGTGWQFDFKTGDFIQTSSGKVLEADELEAYKQWATKALLTNRYKYNIYSHDYGSEFDTLIGQSSTESFVKSEIQQMITDTLMVDKRTVSVGNFVFDIEGDTIYVSCDVVTQLGTTNIDTTVEI